MISDKTMSFKVEKDKNLKTKEILKEVYQALEEKGYNPINQIVGYILSGDPTYITSHKEARNIIRMIERDELLEKINSTGIGPAGYGGKTTALTLNIETLPTHIAGMPVAVSICCHVARHKEAKL